MRNVILYFIKVYQRVVSPAKGPTCRFRPTCSEYTYEAIEKLGVLEGGYMSIGRLLRCHPWSKGGYDPVKRAGGGYKK